MFLHIPRAHDQGQICLYGFISKYSRDKRSCVSTIPPVTQKELENNVLLPTLQLTSLLLKSFRVHLYFYTLIYMVSWVVHTLWEDLQYSEKSFHHSIGNMKWLWSWLLRISTIQWGWAPTMVVGLTRLSPFWCPDGTILLIPVYVSYVCIYVRVYMCACVCRCVCVHVWRGFSRSDA